MMKKITLLATMLFVASMGAYAQDEYPKFELAGTFNFVRADLDVFGNESIYGYGIGAQYNANKYFGIVGEWTAAHGTSGPASIVQDGVTYDIPEFDTRVQTLMAGPRFSYRPKAVTVFGHWLLGAGTNKIDWGTSSYTKWQFAMAIGGGVDVNVSKHFAIRAVQIDWMPIHSNLELQGANNYFNNIRYQFGGVIKF
jgi:opacity protein-like surface antigen